MNIKITIGFVCFAAVVHSSCEGYRCGNGKVLDKQTNQPLDSVFCETLTSQQRMYTDTSGRFDVCNRISGCVPKCKDIVIRFSKDGYKTVTVENPPENAAVYLEK